MSERILTSIHGRKMGLTKENGLVLVRAAVGTDKGKGKAREVGNLAIVEVTSAQLLALNATPQTIVAAPGAGFVLMPRALMIYKQAGTAYAGIAAGEDLVLKYTNASGAQASSVIETTGFLDQTTAQLRATGLPGSTTTTAGDFTPVVNSPLVLHLLTGEITTGTGSLMVHLVYDVLPLVTA